MKTQLSDQITEVELHSEGDTRIVLASATSEAG